MARVSAHKPSHVKREPVAQPGPGNFQDVEVVIHTY